MKDFLKNGTGWIIALIALIGFMLFAHHAFGNPAERDFAQFCLDSAKDFKIALLTLITGGAAYAATRHEEPPKITEAPKNPTPDNTKGTP